MFAAVTIVWLYLAGLWVLYASINKETQRESAELEMDFLGGAILLSWFVSIPAITLWSLLTGSDDDE